MESADVAQTYLRDPKLRKEDVKAIEDWLGTQPHLPQITELQIILFLHSCHYALEATKTTIENYFTFKTTSDLFKNVDEDLIRKVLKSFFVAFLPRRTPDGDAVILIKLIDSNPDKYNCTEHSKVLLLVIYLYFHQYGPADGLIVVSDMKGTSLGHMFRLNISAVRQLLFFVQEAAPVRLKAVHHINTVPLTERIIAIVKPFMKKETYNMIKFHHSMDTFFELVPRECFPEEYGGSLPSVLELQEQNLKNILEQWKFLEWHNMQQVDDSKRPKKEKSLFSSIQKMFH